MHEVFATVIRPLLTAVKPTTVLEVGAGQGRLTRWLVQHSHATVHAVDPAPALDPDVVSTANGRLVVHPARSLEVLRGLPAVDLAILDGDPNWYTVISELRLLAGDERADPESLPVIVLHNVDWPFGRRDGYYDPEAIPAAWRSPNAPLGVVPGHNAPSEDGLSLVPFVGTEERLPNSGVRTAIEDFLAENPDRWRFVEVPGLHGIGVLAAHDRLRSEPKLVEVLDGYERPEFLTAHLDTIERERVVALIRPGANELEDRVDALQTRLELLERGGLSAAPALQAANPIWAPQAEPATLDERRRLAESERARERVEAELREQRERQRELARALQEAAANAGALQDDLQREHETARAAREQAADQQRALLDALEETERLREGLATLLEERRALSKYAESAARSHAWRIGHRITSIGRLVTFRRSHGTSALDRLQERLARTQLELPRGAETTAPENGEPQGAVGDR